MILPIVKEYEEGDGLCAVPARVTYHSLFGCEAARIGAEAFASFLDGAEKSDAKAFVEFYEDVSLEARDEIYSVSVTSGRITVGFRDARGAVNGAATVALLLRKKEIPACRIVDYPSFEYRSFLLDIARGVPNEDEVLSIIRYLALAKYNRLHLHLAEHCGLCYRSDAVPEYQLLDRGEPCEKEFLRRIAKACEGYAIEIVPEIEIPAHATALCHAHPEFMCLAEGAHGWAICPGNDDVWRFYDALIGEIAEIFPKSEYIHIGTDELEFGDLGERYHCYWDECPRCAALRKREGLADLRAEFYYVVDRMLEIVKAHGKKMMMWNDQIDVSRDVPISREITVQFWRIAAPGRGPHEGCTMAKFIEKGFKVINSFYRYTYTDRNHYLSPEKMKRWNPYRTPEEDEVVTDQILGGEICAWMYGEEEEYGFLGYVVPPSIVIAGDKLWNGGEREHTEDYRRAVSEFVFGTDEFTCIFDVVGDMIPPRDVNLLICPDAPQPTEAQVSACLDRLKGIGNPSCRMASEKYIALFEKIAKQIRS